MLEFDEFKLELDKYKGSLAELGESLELSPVEIENGRIGKKAVRAWILG